MDSSDNVFVDATVIMALRANNAQELANWCGGKVVIEHDALDPKLQYPAVNVPVGEDVKRASFGDVIILKFDETFDVIKASEWRKLIKE